jgi:hypothetical protein
MRHSRQPSPIRFNTRREAEESAKLLSEKWNAPVCVLEAESFIRAGEDKFVEFEPF